MLGLLSSELLPLLTGTGEVFTVLGIRISMGLVTIRLASLGKQNERSSVGGLEAEGEVQQDEWIDIETKNAHRIEGDPYRHDDRLADEEGGRAEEPGKGLCLESEPITAEDRCKMDVGSVETEVIFFRCNWGRRFIHGFK